MAPAVKPFDVIECQPTRGEPLICHVREGKSPTGLCGAPWTGYDLAPGYARSLVKTGQTRSSAFVLCSICQRLLETAP